LSLSPSPEEDAVRIAAAQSGCHRNLSRVGGLTVSRATDSGHTRPASADGNDELCPFAVIGYGRSDRLKSVDFGVPGYGRF